MNNYWEERFKQLEKASNSYGEKIYREIEDIFKESELKIQKEIESWYGRFAKNNNITMAEAKKLLNTRELNEFKWDVNKYIKAGKENSLNQKWMKELENASSRFHVNRLEALNIRLQQINELAFQNQLDHVDDMANKIFKNNYYHTIFEIQKGFNVGFDVSEVSDRRIRNIISKPWLNDGENFSSRIWKNKNKLISEIHKELTQTIILGGSPNRIIKNISKKMNINKVNASRLVMTELAFFHTISQKQAFKELDVDKYEILAVLDYKTSLICQDFDGRIFNVKDMKIGINAPPFHPNCRSVILPYYKNYGEGLRAVSGEDRSIYYVPSDMKYKEWKDKFVNNKLSDFDNSIKVKTYEEAKHALISKVGFKSIDDSFDKIDKELAIENTNQLIVLEEKFGIIHKSDSIIMSKGVANKTVIAYVKSGIMNPIEQNLSLTYKYYKDKQEFIDKELNLKKIKYNMPFIDANASIYTVTHEYGHMIQNKLIYDKMIEKGWTFENRHRFTDNSKFTRNGMLKWYIDIQKSVIKKCASEIKKIACELDKNFKLRENISKYGNTNDAEFFAEVFANSQLGEPNVLGKAMNIWLERNGLVK